jgi:protein-arginine kinase
MNASEVENRIEDESKIVSTRIRVARNINGCGLPPGCTRE